MKGFRRMVRLAKLTKQSALPPLAVQRSDYPYPQWHSCQHLSIHTQYH
jgi:hypothetical protein